MRWRKSLQALFILITFYSQDIVAEDKLRICIVDSQHTNKNVKKSCHVLDQPESPIECVLANDRFNCLRKVAEEKADFTVLGPEDLFAASAWSEIRVLVINELRFGAEEKYQYQVVALMRNRAGIERLSDVKGKRFCHPGYESTSNWSPIFATYFENTLIEKECDPNKTLIENRISAASKFFGAACMPGQWTTDAMLDSRLKSKYRNLCALCYNPVGCYANDRYAGPEGAVQCLTDNAGDIAWVQVAQAETLFKTLGLNKGEYSYLCPDGTTRFMETEEPCLWIARPWPVIVANSKKNDAVSRLFLSLNEQKSVWYSTLVRLLENYHLTGINPENLGTPEDYLNRVPGFLSANTRSGCRPSRTIKWCVSSSVEQRKCSWLSQASSVYGVEPMISCITRLSRLECMEAVRDGKVDLIVITPDEELTARQKGLKRVVHVFTNDNENINRIAAVVKSSLNIKSLQELKGLKACFTGYRSIGWNSFVSIMRNSSGSDWDTSDEKAVSNFFKESCVLGLGKNNDTMPPNLYSLCEKEAKYGDETSAFKCLVNGGGDVAFISLNTIRKNTGFQNQQTWATGLKGSEFKPICFNDSNPDTCFLTWTTLGSVMVHENISVVRFEEIYSALLQMDQSFGRSFKAQTPAFLMYGSYDEEDNIIFPEQTQHLQSDISHVKLERNYEQIVDDMISNPPHSDARQLYFNSLSISCIVIILMSQTMS